MKTIASLLMAASLLALSAAPASAQNAATTTNNNSQQIVPIHRDFDQSMRAMRDQMDQMFRNFFDRTDNDIWSGGFETVVATDVIEEEKDFLVKIELPGMKAENIDLSVTGNTITVKGDKQQENELKNESYLRREMSYGSFSRSVTLPETADLNKADATYKDGVLTITVPKNPAAAPKSHKLTIRQ
ncbi:MAG TPA: Hsp20/alpha crystallin family protein [Patescibacteria group bacterium]|nr:Hsp20/alpha crystallin family protein [Patescibacteria group bacterium]